MRFKHWSWILGSAALFAVGAVEAYAQNGTWIAGSVGTYNYPDTVNWNGGIVANGAGSTADFSDLDLNGDVSVTIDAPLTIGHLSFGDTDLGSAGSWEVRTTNASVITLDAAAPTITVNPLTPTTFDDALIGNSLAGTNGFSKNGAGILTINSNSSGLTGPILVNQGTLRLGAAAVLAGSNAAPITLATSTVLDVDLPAGGTVDEIGIAAGATATIDIAQNTFLSDVRALGAGSTLNLNMAANRTASGNNDWVTGGGFANVNITGTGGQRGFFRGRFNGGGWNPAAFANSHLNLNNVQFFVLCFSSGNDVTIGQLSGTATSELKGSGAGGASRYIIGGLNNNADFGGVVNGAGGMAINKVGTGTQTFSGSFIGTAGQIIRVSDGTMALTNTATSIPGGTSDAAKTTIDVLAGATFDVSGTSTVFTSSAFEKFQGTGTIVGPFSHTAGEIRPADVATGGGLTTAVTPTAGTINFSGSLAFNGGAIVYDMAPTPAGANDLILVSGTTSVAGGGVVQPNFLAGTPAAGQTYTFLQSTSGFTDAVSGWTVAWPGRGPKPTVFIDGNFLKFTTTSATAGASLVWSGAVDANWDVEATQNWVNGVTPDKFFQGDDVVFNDTGNNTDVVVTVPVAPASILVDADTKNYSFSGNSIGGTGILTKRGTSTLTINNTNSFAGAALEEGTVALGANTGGLGAGTLTMGAAGLGATLTTTGGFLSNGTLQLAGGNNQLTVDNATAFEMPTLAGSGNLIVASNDDALRLDLNGVAAGFGGNITFGLDPDTITPAAMTVRISGAANDLPGAAVTLVNGANLVSQTGTSTIASLELGSLAGDNTTTLAAFTGGGTTPGTNWVIGGLNSSTEFAGAVVDSNATTITAITKVGTGTLTLSGANTYTGNTTVSGGTLSLTSAYLADASDIAVATGAILNLNYVGEDTVDSLTLEGLLKAAGKWGALGSVGTDFQSALITGTGILNVLTGAVITALPGDFNDDGVVDAADYTVWRDNLTGAESILPPGTGDNSGTVDAGDYNVWRANFGATAGPGSLSANGGTVPEPASMLLFALVAGLVAAARRRK